MQRAVGMVGHDLVPQIQEFPAAGIAVLEAIQACRLVERGERAVLGLAGGLGWETRSERLKRKRRDV
jgi:hypothetical protein